MGTDKPITELKWLKTLSLMHIHHIILDGGKGSSDTGNITFVYICNVMPPTSPALSLKKILNPGSRGLHCLFNDNSYKYISKQVDNVYASRKGSTDIPEPCSHTASCRVRHLCITGLSPPVSPPAH